MSIEHGVRGLAGGLVLLSLILARLVSPYFLLLTAVIGLNLIQSAFTGFCPAELVLRKVLPPR